MDDQVADSLVGVRSAALVGRPGAERARNLVNNHFGFVWRVLRRLGVRAAEVDDAAQQVFWVAVRKIEPDPSGRDEAFLLSVAVRVASDFRRRARNRRELVGVDCGEPADPRRSPEDELLFRRRLSMADGILEAMPWELRVVFVLYEIEQKTTPEIASLLGIPLGTAASRLRRARAAFTEAVEVLRAERSDGGRRR